MPDSTNTTTSKDTQKRPLKPKPPTTKHRERQGAVEQEIHDPDSVQRGMMDVWGWVEDNSKAVVSLIVIVLIASIAVVAYHAYQNRMERVAQEAYYEVEAKYSKLRDGFERAKYAALLPKEEKEKGGVGQIATGDLQKDYGTVVDDLVGVARRYPRSAAGAQAAILAAETYLEYKQPAKAAEAAQIPVKSLDPNSLLANLSRVAWGTAMADKGDCQLAVTIWQPILDNKATAYLHAEAALRSGICYEVMNQNDKAAEMYRQAAADESESEGMGGRGSPVSDTAKTLLRALDVKGRTTVLRAGAAK